MKLRLRVLLPALALAAGAIAALPAVAQKSTVDAAKRQQKARETALTLAERLRSQLAAAIKSGGMVSALGLCQTISPDLVTSANDEFGFETGRTAFRLRNPENAPDEWELKVLQLFQSQIAAGTDPAKLEFAETVTTAEGDKLFRYIKPIMTADMCLGCHGTDVKPDVKAEIARYYPEDKAMGFKLGELRGAFSLVQLVEE